MVRKKLERDFQAGLIVELEEIFEGCVILKNDSSYLQGVPDLLVLWQDRWAMLEVKRGLHEKRQPNQKYYVELMNDMSFAAFICPENKEDILDALQSAFRGRRTTRVSKR